MLQHCSKNCYNVEVIQTNKTVLLVRNIWHDAYGGGEKYQIELSKLLVKHGFNPVIVSSSKALLAVAKSSGLKTQRGLWLTHQNWSGYRLLFFGFYVFWQIILFFWYRYLIKKYRPIALHIQSRDDMIAGTLAGHNTKTRVIWTDHADFREIWQNVDVKFKNPIGKIIRRVAKYTYKIATVSKSEYNFIAQHAGKNLSKKMVMTPNGIVDKYDSKFNPEKRSYVKICFIGRIIASKGVFELIEAFKLAKSQIPNLRLDIIGDGPEAPLARWAAKNTEHISFTGFLNDPMKHLASCDVFVLPTYKEGLSTSLLEASMMQKAIITTDIDNNREIATDHQTGLLVPVKDTKKLCSAIVELAENPDLRIKLAKNARLNYLKNFDFNKIVADLIIPLYL